MIKKIDHLVITTANIKPCLAFYKSLGFHCQEAGERWEFFAGDFKLNVHLIGHELEPKAQNVEIGSADIFLETDESIVDCMDQLIKNGVVVELGIVKRHGVRGEMQSIYLRDPDGNLIEICSYK